MSYEGTRKTHKRRGKPPVGLLFILAGVAIILAGCALWFAFRDKGETPKNPDAGQGDTVAPDGGETPSAPADDKTLSAQRAALLSEVDLLTRGYFYDEAIDRINKEATLKNAETDAKAAEISALKAALVKYSGTQYYHIFFHSLIADTAKAFDGDEDSAGYNMYMTTVSEFQKMLPLLLENNFVLYPITEMVDFSSGKALPKDIYLPAGKKPLVLSIDDVNYYEYMKEDGFAERLDVDENGNVVTVMLNADGTEAPTYDGDVMPILDSFVREHPEFSWRGAKGIVATTGYQGAFGYRITDLPDYSAEKQQWMLGKVKEVADALHATGWKIASHSYTHNQYWTNKSMTMDQLKYDTGRWVGEIEPFVGDTDIIITPFGVLYGQDDERFRYIVDQGFHIYCPVGSQMATSWQNDNMLMDRLNLDGLTMIKYPDRISKHFFDPKLVLDPARPPMD